MLKWANLIEIIPQLKWNFLICTDYQNSIHRISIDQSVVQAGLVWRRFGSQSEKHKKNEITLIRFSKGQNSIWSKQASISEAVFEILE